ncbi:MAG: PspC domain-containing protein [Alphaproteobacteria bacterium]|nr:PspC domain-containing protein [Alphaproteobacteria bacterium]
MERVVTINLNGNSYQLEEPAYDALRSYMSRAEAALGANPDKAEIVRDLEQAIAEKCSARLSPGKSVVSASEMTRILEEMGPVEGEAESGAQQQQSGAAPQHEPWRPARRLYRIYDNGAWTGVSAGMAAYAGVDVAWVRVFWIVSGLFTGGFTCLAYLVMIFAVPVASTSEEIAAAHGAPFNAQEVIDRARREAGRFAETSSASWRREERRWRRSWRKQQRAADADWAAGAAQAAAAPAYPVGYVERMFAGLFAFVFSIITAALLIAFLIAFFSILSNGSVMGWTPPGDVPTWLVLVVLAIAYAAISSPFSALQRTSYATLSGRRTGGATDGLATLAIVVIVGAFAWTYSEEARAFIEQGYVVVRDFVTYWSSQG